MVSRHAALALIALVASAGCRAAGFNDGPGKPAPIAPKAAPAPEASEYIERINANAERVASLEAHPTISVGSLDGRREALVKGDLAVERPRNFRLMLNSPVMGREEADLGSNEQEFWFWSGRDNKERAIFVCEYDDAGDGALPTAMQPDWIVEAMGLRTIPPDEAAGATIKANARGDAVLTVRRRGAQGEALIKETIFDAATGQVKEHRLLKDDKLKGKKVLLANATISRWQAIAAPKAAPGEAAADPVKLPQAINLAWHEQNLKMGVTLNGAKLNPRFDDDQRAELFTEPKMAHVTRRSFPGLPPLASGASTRKSRSIPPSPSARRGGAGAGSNGVELGDPIPAPGAGAADGETPSPADPRPLDADLPPLSARGPRREAFVGASIPTAPVDFAEAGPSAGDASAGFLR